VIGMADRLAEARSPLLDCPLRRWTNVARCQEESARTSRFSVRTGSCRYS
jgi:hypothetical protein